MNRRKFLLGSAALGSAFASNFGLNSLSFAQSGGSTKTIIKIFQRGGADGLHLFPPVNDPDYINARPNVRVEANNGNATSAVTLPNRGRSPNPGNKIALNPNLTPLLEIWDEGDLAISPATHYNNSSRSHFDSQQIIEFGLGQINAESGFFNRYLEIVNPALNDTDTLRAIRAGINSNAPVFFGNVSVPVAQDGNGGLISNDFCSGTGCSDNQLTETLRTLASRETDNELENHVRAADTQLVDTLEIIRVASSHNTDAGGLEYTNTDMGRGLRLISQLLKDGNPVEVASLNWNNPGWDTHANHLANPGAVLNGNHAEGVREGANDLLTFYRDMRNSGLLDDVIVIVGSEFGREVSQNGSRGTDHGFGGAWFSYGGPTNGGIYNAYDNLRPENLQAGRFVPHIVSYQDIVGEAMWRHLGVNDAQLAQIFPGHQFTDLQMYA